ncbi:hypothetical protein, partial [Streptomyces sp. OR43]|uniref:hypothetical protein n=1 Tax=Streptomyces sp. or43 TaxID=2478957 RepID=UPI0013A40F89
MTAMQPMPPIQPIPTAPPSTPSYPQEVVVDPSPLPEPGRVAHDVVQGVRRRVQYVRAPAPLALLGRQL